MKPFRFLTPVKSRYFINTYDEYVVNVIQDRRRAMIFWRNYERFIQEPNEIIRLKIIGGMLIGGMWNINYSIKRGNFTQGYSIHVPDSEISRY